MKSYIPKFIYGAIDNNILWFIDYENNLLMKLDLEDEIIYAVCYLTLDNNSDEKHTHIIKRDDYLYIFPGNGKTFLKYDLHADRLELMYSSINDFRCADVIEIDNELIAFSANRNELPVCIDIKSNYVKTYSGLKSILSNKALKEFATLSVVTDGDTALYSIYGTNSIIKCDFNIDKIQEIKLSNEISINKLYILGKKQFILDVNGNILIQTNELEFERWDSKIKYIDAVVSKNKILFIPKMGGSFLEYDIMENEMKEIHIDIDEEYRHRNGVIIDDFLLLFPFYHTNFLKVDLNAKAYQIVNIKLDRKSIDTLDFPQIINEGIIGVRYFLNII